MQQLYGRWRFLLCCVLVAATGLMLAVPRATADESAAQARAIDPATLRHKVMCGYQGWFRSPGDGTGEGWVHWSRDGRRISPKTVTFEMWPDMSEYGADEQFAADAFTYPGGRPAHLFSSAHPQTVERHFQWMQQYGLDGVFLQRFLVDVKRPSTERVLENVRAAAGKSGRVYAIGYDLSQYPPDRLLETLTSDWQRLVDEKRVTRDKQYLHHNGKPVLLVWGFFSDRFDAALAHRILDFFGQDGPYGVTLIGGCQWHWRKEKDAEWAKAFRRFDVISPWNVGHVGLVDDRKQAATHYWKEDLAEAKRAGMQYLPVIYPGFGWTNLKGKDRAQDTIPRLGGEFYWRQFVAASEHDIEMAYVAMFDEVDEATAIFKVTNDPPTQANFATYEGLPTDWYLRLTGEGAKLLRGERQADLALPIRP